MSVYKCPFCGKQLTIISKEVYICKDCKLFVDMQKTKATVLPDAPDWVKETEKLLNMLPMLNPKFVLSPYPLFSKKFTAGSCRFFGCTDSRFDCHVTDNLLTAKELHLIAGRHFIANNLVKTFRAGLELHYQVSPMERNTYEDCGYEMWLHIVTNAYEVKDSSSTKLANAFFAPDMEDMIQRLFNKFDVETLPDVTDEQALYSMVFCDPQLFMKWSDNAEDMAKSIHLYILNCLGCVSCKKYGKYEDIKLPDSVVSDKRLLDDLEKLYYMSKASTALNMDTDGIVHVDILNPDNLVENIGSKLLKEVDRSALHSLISTYRLLAALRGRYTADHIIYGTKMKRKWLASKGAEVPEDADEMVLKFWIEMRKDLQHEEV